MTDTLTPEQRRKTMQAVKSANTKPEIVVRKIAHRLGYRFRLHVKNLPGKPDLAFPRLRKAIFVHGCFWHAHPCKHGKSAPKTNAEYWTEKRKRNAARDKRNIRDLKKEGWEALVIWECKIKDAEKLAETISSFLSGKV